MPTPNDPLHLTPQQQAVVAHDTGPALVFAVAGAGKTTAMVHRIQRLVAEQGCPPAQILATSFGEANITDLQRALDPPPVQDGKRSSSQGPWADSFS